MKPAPWLLIVALSGCFGFEGHGCFVDGGTAVWHQEGAFSALQQAAANDTAATRTLLQTQAGIAFPHEGLQEAWGQWYRLEQIRYDDGAGGPLVSLDLTESPPVVRAATFDADVAAVRDRTTAFVTEITEPGEDVAGWVEQFLDSDDQGRGEARFYAAEMDLDLRLLERFNGTQGEGQMHPDSAQAMRWSDETLHWTFSLLAQEIHKPGHLPVRSNTADWIFAEVDGDPEGDAEAQALAAATIASYNVTTAGFPGWRFDPHTVCG